MKLGHVSVFALALGLFTLAPGSAGADFSEPAVTHSYAGHASLKITEPAGFKVSASFDGKVVEDTVPHIFAVPDTHAYVPVTITAPDGKSWAGKIEVKPHETTQISFKYAAPAGAAPSPAAPAARKFIGHLLNGADRCAPQAQFSLRYEILDDKGGAAQTVQLNAGQDKTIELPAGAYSVRVFWFSNNEWKYQDTFKSVNISDDKWGFGVGCAKKNSTTLSRTR
jgi:hypothetical protein